VRFAVDAEMIVLDRAKRLPGRGAYVCPDQACARQAIRRGAFPRRLRVAATAADGLEQRLQVERGPVVWEN
jgi:uncharacterized protein